MERVLIVDDDQSDRIIHGNIIEGTGREVYFAPDGGQALRICARKSIDVVVTDLEMPHAGGLVLITTLRVAFPNAAIIAVSGGGSDLLAKAESKGAFVALSKPVDPSELIEALAEAAPKSLQEQRAAS